MIGVSFIYPQYLWLLLLIPVTAGLALIGRRALSRARLWGGLVLRAFLLLFIILALAGIQLRLPTNTLTAVFVLDASDSVPPAEQARGEEFIRQAIENMPRGDKAAIVVFGEDALVERLSSEDSSLARLSSVPVTTRTDIASALQLGMALFPDEGARRLVLLSDGRENLSYALKQAELAAFQNIELQYVPLGEAQDQVEVLVDAIQAPADIREGQQFELGITVQSTARVGATMRVFADGTLVHTQELDLQTGANRYTVPVKDSVPGFHRYRVLIAPDADNRLQNNEASAFTVVHGPPSILIVEGAPGESENLTGALEAAKMEVTVIPPSNMPATLPELARYDAVVLANVPASALPSGAMESLPIYVRDLGKGLLMTGGDNAFGAGGYLRTPLETAMPVYMDVKSRELAANLALMVAVDKSGSMARCHCDNPDLNQTYTPVQAGQPKVDIAKEAIMRSAAALGEEDYLGVVTFDTQAHWALEVQPLVGEGALESAIGTFQAEGQTNMYSGVTAAYQALEKVNAKRKHIILMTDGWVRTGDLTDLVNKMHEQGITLSVIAAGEGSAEYLKALAEDGGGRYYPAKDMMSVPDIFLKETVKSVGQYIIEEPFYPLPASPSPVLRGIDQNTLPGLLGYNGTSPKGTSRLDLLTPRGDPLLATWQYGLGRSAAWTSDLKGRWATDWLKWNEFSRFSAQLVGWLIPSPQVEGLSAQVSLQDEGAIIDLEANDKEGRPLNNLSVQGKLIDPDLGTIEVPLKQVGPGKYQAITSANQPGTYLVWLGASSNDQPLGQMTLGLVVPYSPEYRAGGLNRGLLDELARITGGSQLAEPVTAFLHNLPAAASAREIWRTLLLIVALLFPIDVALRRLIISRQEMENARAWITQWLQVRRKGDQQGEAPILGRLFNARERARSRTTAPPPTDLATGEIQQAFSMPASPHEREKAPATQEPQAHTPKDLPAEPAAPGSTPPDSLARLREAKKRARR
jgi:Mg-chelatase subunit ChlD